MTAAPSFEAGTIIDGKYRVERILGQGAMGVVLAATHLVLGHRVALKVMRGQAAAGSDLQARFLREARIVAMLKTQHAGAVRALGFLDTGEPYMELNLYEGEDLSGYLKARGALTVEEAVTYVLQACEAVAEAHALGIVHRDLKPANLSLTKSGGQPCIKVLDFGVSKLRGEDTRLTQTGASLGSPLYMSPELMQSAKDADGRADIWALGTILYELLTENAPFATDTMAALMVRVLLRDPTPITQFRRDIPPGLVSAIMRCLAKDPAQRWQNVAAFAAQIAPYAPARMQHYVERVAAAQAEVRTVVPLEALMLPVPQPKLTPTVLVAPPAPVLEAAAANTAAEASASRRPLAAVGLAIMGCVLVVGMLVLGRRTSGAPAPSALRTAEEAESPSASALVIPPIPAPELRPITPTAAGSTAAPAPSAAVTVAATSKPVVTVAPRRPVQPGAPGGNLYDRGTKK